MKIKSFNKGNAGFTRDSEPNIHIHKSGMITFNRKACEHFKISDGSKIEFAQDEDNPEDWFFHHSKSDDAFPARQKDPERGGAIIQCATIVRALFKANGFGEDIKSITCKIQADAHKHEKNSLHLIITADAKKREAF
jgi:hypothetical protein